MAFYIYSPHWFSGIDSILELITIITSLLISYYAYKTYKYYKIKKYKYFSISFLLFSIAFITKIILNLIFIIPVKKQIIMPYLTYTYTSYIQLPFIENISFIIHKISLLLSLLILFFILDKQKNIEHILLTTILTITLAILIENYMLFNLIIIIIISYILIISIIKDKIKFKEKNKEKKIQVNKNLNNLKIKIEQKINSLKNYSNLTIFLIGINLSYFSLFLAVENHNFYFLGEVILAISFLFLLYNLIKIFKK